MNVHLFHLYVHEMKISLNGNINGKVKLNLLILENARLNKKLILKMNKQRRAFL